MKNKIEPFESHFTEEEIATYEKESRINFEKEKKEFFKEHGYKKQENEDKFVTQQREILMIDTDAAAIEMERQYHDVPGTEFEKAYQKREFKKLTDFHDFL